jgi:hypothetical protein
MSSLKWMAVLHRKWTVVLSSMHLTCCFPHDIKAYIISVSEATCPYAVLSQKLKSIILSVLKFLHKLETYFPLLNALIVLNNLLFKVFRS